ncbi:carotenoid oxygenase family protein [Prochlorococcus sp. MIT 1300]|uniref:carotenoid oxygenase family protein n=1 Tax=Prochlorococcus sp. MIT 1300 TaxID=3096218 RepID=UPI002A75D378|nr:carotenoid oxygenase family protein [Prochlorococcus sp. MIT 1300]
MTKDFDREDWASAYRNVEEELTDVEVFPTKGIIPKELNGTLYRNGPGRLERNGQWVHHPFDGDGMITALCFKAGKIKLTNRFVRTSAWEEEEQAGKFLYRGVFGTQKPGGALKNAFDLRLKNIANTNVIRLGDELLALWEAAGPYALDPTTLKTLGLSTLNDALKTGEAFSAHPRFDPGHHESPRMVTFGVKTGPSSTIRLMEFASEGPDAGQLLSERHDQFNGFAFLHDFAITPNWAIFLQNAINFNPLPFLLGQKGAAQCLSSGEGKQSKFCLIPRDSGAFAGEPPKIFDAPEGFVFHHLNASEKDGEVIIESIYYNDFPTIKPKENFRKVDFNSIPEGKLTRCNLNLSDGTISSSILSPQCCEFAVVNPFYQGIAAKYAWMAVAEKEIGNAPLQSIKKLNLIDGTSCLWSAAPRGFVSEPLMVPSKHNQKEDNGWILVLVWNGKRQGTDLVILQASDLKEQSVVELPIAIPHGLHGSWSTEQ